jgi:hypothetical protein
MLIYVKITSLAFEITLRKAIRNIEKVVKYIKKLKFVFEKLALGLNVT